MCLINFENRLEYSIVKVGERVTFEVEGLGVTFVYYGVYEKVGERVTFEVVGLG